MALFWCFSPRCLMERCLMLRVTPAPHVTLPTLTSPLSLSLSLYPVSPSVVDPLGPSSSHQQIVDLNTNCRITRADSLKPRQKCQIWHEIKYLLCRSPTWFAMSICPIPFPRNNGTSLIFFCIYVYVFSFVFLFFFSTIFSFIFS